MIRNSSYEYQCFVLYKILIFFYKNSNPVEMKQCFISTFLDFRFGYRYRTPVLDYLYFNLSFCFLLCEFITKCEGESINPGFVHLQKLPQSLALSPRGREGEKRFSPDKEDFALICHFYFILSFLRRQESMKREKYQYGKFLGIFFIILDLY